MRPGRWFSSFLYARAYMLGCLGTRMFGLMLMCAECHINFFDKRIRKMCGFLYGYLGRTCFILLYVTTPQRATSTVPSTVHVVAARLPLRC